MPASDSLRARLRSSTAEAHKRLESLLKITRSDLSARDYDQVLTKFLSFYRPFESHLLRRAADGCQASEFYRRTHRLKAPLLLRDTERLETHPADETFDFSWLDSEAKVWGSMYVIEGSTLGSVFIAKHLQTLGPDFRPAGGREFFTGYGSETKKKWDDFLENLTRVPAESFPESETAAKQTFLEMTRLFAKRSADWPALQQLR